MRHCIAVLVVCWLGPSIPLAARAVEIDPPAKVEEGEVPAMRGKIVLFVDFRGEGAKASHGIHVVDPGTGAWAQVAAIPRANGIVATSYLRLSPDGREIAFNEYQQAADRSHSSPASVWLRGIGPADGPRRISQIGGRPIWSPDGEHLLLVEAIGEFDSLKPGRYATWRVNADGSHPARLPIPEGDAVADWSSDGRWLAAVSPAPDGAQGLDVVLVHPDGSDRRRLTESGCNLAPRFSPDGRRVAYVTNVDDEKEVWVAGVEGSGRRKIYASQGDSFIERFAWSPDGRHLAAVLLTWTRDEKGGRFLGGETLGSPRLCILDIEGGEMKVLAHPPAAVLGDPDWR